jgi:ATP-dependent Zn protease
VDPALRRAGRLDRVIEIPYPSSEALSAMFSDYLAAQRDKVGLDPMGIDVALLGRMAFGLTGADVDQLVRGAARRARRAGRTIATEDLLAEITRKPREGTVSRRLQPAEVERVAIHEAGHALARYLGSTRGKDIGFVSVVPRSDGSLGFVALAPDDRVLLTKLEYHEFLAVALAGRAAEELKYGPDGVSGGCSNDLASATTTALRMITRFGLGPEGRLISTDRPGPEHLQEAEALLSRTYASTLETLRAHRSPLERLAATLVARQELTAEEVLATLAGS